MDNNKLNCAKIFYENESFQVECLFCNEIFGVEFENLIEHLEKHLGIEDSTTGNSSPYIDETIFHDEIINPISPETELGNKSISESNDTSGSPKTGYIITAAKLSEIDNLYHCPYADCNEKGETKELVEMHVIIRHILDARNCNEKSTFQCYKCDHKLSTRKSFIRHLKNVHVVSTSVNINPSNADGKYYCPLCNDSYLELKFLNQHLRYKHEEFFFVLLKNQLELPRSKEKNTVNFDETNDIREQVDCKDLLFMGNLSPKPNDKNNTTQYNTRIFKCDICEKKLARKNSLIRHILNVHKISLAKCTQCKKKICNCTTIENSDKFHNKNEAVESEDSDLESNNELKEEAFTEEITTESVYIESLELSTDFSKMETELDQVSEQSNENSKDFLINEPAHTVPVVQSSEVDNLYHCPFQNCNQAFESEDLIQIHMITTHMLDFCNDNDSYKCPKCKAELNSKNDFIRHLHTYHGMLIEHDSLEQNKRTENCRPNKSCIGKSGVKNKLSKKPKNKIEKEFHCDICGKVLLTPKKMAYHKLTHKDRRFKCEYCNKKFIFYQNLVDHREIHTGDKNYKCEYCDSAFLRRGDRNSHVNRVHIKTKKNQCEICGKGFYTPSELSSHNRRHTGEKKYKCDICDKCYFDKGHLRAHMDSHSKIKGKRFPCELCNSKFSSTKSLRAHKAIHSNEKKYHCVICNQSFKQNAGLYSHNKTHHQHIIEENRLLKLKANYL